jgi:hypothetical protein
MAPIPKKVAERLVAGIKRYQPILAAAKARDAGEADTSTIVKDMLNDVFGYDKFAEVTSEHAIRGTYCDVAIHLDGALRLLIEVKAIGTELKDPHVRQAVDYAANKGVEWVILTNGINWRAYRVVFGKPIDQDLVIEFDSCAMSHKSQADLETLFLLCKEAWLKSMISDYHTQRQALSRYFVGAMLLTDPVLDVIRRSLRKMSPDVKIEAEQIKTVLINEVIKRDTLEGDKADEAKRRINRATNKMLRVKEAKVACAVGEDGASDQGEVTPLEPVGSSDGGEETPN